MTLSSEQRDTIAKAHEPLNDLEKIVCRCGQYKPCDSEVLLAQLDEAEVREGQYRDILANIVTAANNWEPERTVWTAREYSLLQTIERARAALAKGKP